MSRSLSLIVIAVAALGCGSKSSDPTPAAAKDPAPAVAPTPPPAPAATFPKERWVHTVLFDGKTPYIGFTYVDPSKGNSIKGEEVKGLTPEQIKAKLHSDFPSSSMEPVPDGHPMTVLTDEEIKQYDLPAEPKWLSFFKR